MTVLIYYEAEERSTKLMNCILMLFFFTKLADGEHGKVDCLINYNHNRKYCDKGSFHQGLSYAHKNIARA